MEIIKVIIADDNKIMNDFIRNYLEGVDEIEVLGTSYTDEEEVYMIENLKPEIVITDLVRNNNLSGLEIIKKYKYQSNMPKFLVITAGGEDFVNTQIMDGYIKKPITDYNLIIKELKKIKEQIIAERLPVKRPKERLKTVNNMLYQFIERKKHKSGKR